MSLPPSDSNKHGEPSTTAGDKRTLRRSLLKLRSEIKPDERKHFDRKISQQVSKYLESFAFSSLGVYLPIRNEPELDVLYAGLSTKMALSLPITSGKEQPLQFFSWSPGDELVVGDYGIAVPKVLKPVPMPVAMLIPCVGFTEKRFRLGYGGGFLTGHWHFIRKHIKSESPIPVWRQRSMQRKTTFRSIALLLNRELCFNSLFTNC